MAQTQVGREAILIKNMVIGSQLAPGLWQSRGEEAKETKLCISIVLRARTEFLRSTPLPSTGITRFHQYCEPLRHPRRPGLSLASCRFDPHRDHRWGFPCCRWSPMRTCHRHYPGRFHRACSLVPLHGQRPSLCNSRVGSCDCFFGACSAFTHVMAYRLAKSPSDPLHRRLRRLCCLHRRSDCYRVERSSSRAGLSSRCGPALFTARCNRLITTVTTCSALARGVFGLLDAPFSSDLLGEVHAAQPGLKAHSEVEARRRNVRGLVHFSLGRVPG